MSRKGAEPKPEPGITEVMENAELRIRVLQDRLAGRDTGTRKDAAEDLEGELRKLFLAEASRMPLDQIRKRVIDGVVDKILRDWEQESPLENEIVDRLIERITSGSRSPGS